MYLLRFKPGYVKNSKKKLKSFKPILINGQAESLPFKNQFFDGVVVSFGLRNFDNINAALKECKRVLKKMVNLYV